MKHPTSLKILQGVFLCSDIYVARFPAIESSDQTKAAKHEPLVYRVEEIGQLLAISPLRRTTCATPRRISGYCASAPASG